MKRLFLVSVLFCFATMAISQTKLTPDLEVKDSSGTVYPYELWRKLLSTGRYAIKINDAAKTGVLVRIPDSEVEKRMMNMPKPRESNFFRTGATIASFNEKDMNGNRFNLKELKGKVVVINFWFINCPPCRQEMPELNEVVYEYKHNKDVVFLALGLDEKYEIQQFLKTSPFAYNIIDNSRFLAQKYGVTSYPTHVVLDRQGKVLFHTTGLAMNTVSWVKRSIDEALKTLPATN